MNIALLLTLSRLAGAPVLAFLLYMAVMPQALLFYVFTSFVLFVLLELTDAFDGYIARRRKEVTVLGKLLDPIADSLLHTTLLVIFLVTKIIPLWLFFIFIYRDTFLLVIRSLYASNNKIQGARLSGKIKTVSLSIAFFIIITLNVLSNLNIHFIPNEICGRHFGFYLLLISAILTLFSAIDYAIAERSLLKNSFNIRV
ncbi:MAG: CDP-diacylglycerol--glycerol-3-phosphate 3-phosphatidyltransferase [Chitinispirillia bacterium]|jgi:CDP-diacylglycerol--glycerol-3-phosphate 3-phosphatidyltransferase